NNTYFYFQAEDGIRDFHVTGVQTCALPICKTGALGQIFSLAEFERNIKLGLFEKGKKLRFYSINSNKKFFSGYGLSDKIGMKDRSEERRVGKEWREGEVR